MDTGSKPKQSVFKQVLVIGSAVAVGFIVGNLVLSGVRMAWDKMRSSAA